MSRVILVVDDEQDILNSIKNGLERNGFEVDTYTDPVKVLANFQPNTYEHIILDIKMCKQTGFDLYHEIKKNDPNAQVSVMAGLPVNLNAFKTIFPEIERQNFIDKPFTLSKLVELINNKFAYIEN